MNGLTLLDEELALLVPDAAPLPWLDGLEAAEQAGALRASARSLLVRGLAEVGDQGLRPVGDVARVVALMSGAAPQLRLVVSVEGQARVPLSVLRPAGPDGVLLHDLSEDGVHALGVLSVEQARELLRGSLDPLGLLSGAHAPSAGAVTRVVLPDGERDDEHEGGGEVVVVAQDGRCWRADGLGAPGVVLDDPALDALVEQLLGLLLARPDS